MIKKITILYTMSILDYIDYDNVHQVKATKFGILSPEKIIKSSVVHIYNHIGKQKGDTTNTLLDPRLGATHGKRNEITKLTQKFDPGCFGHTVLTKPVYHPTYFQHYIKALVASTCPSCSSLRFRETAGEEIPGETHRQELLNLTKRHLNAQKFAFVTNKAPKALSKNATSGNK